MAMTHHQASPASDERATEPAGPAARGADHLETALQHVRQALVGLQFGTVSLIVQDGVVVQVERVERTRFRRGKR
jgi:hypothetical protein